jgi:hypothetical protein
MLCCVWAIVWCCPRGNVQSFLRASQVCTCWDAWLVAAAMVVCCQAAVIASSGQQQQQQCGFACGVPVILRRQSAQQIIALLGAGVATGSILPVGGQRDVERICRLLFCPGVHVYRQLRCITKHWLFASFQQVTLGGQSTVVIGSFVRCTHVSVRCSASSTPPVLVSSTEPLRCAWVSIRAFLAVGLCNPLRKHASEW